MKALSLFLAAMSLSSAASASSLNYGDSKYAALRAVLNNVSVEAQVNGLNEQGYNLEDIRPIEAGKSIASHFSVVVSKSDERGRLVTCSFNVVVGQAPTRSSLVKFEVKDIQPVEQMQCQ